MLETKNDRRMLTNRWYNIGKRTVQIYLPAISSLYFSLDAIWGLPKADEVVGTFAVLATFLGVCLGISSRQYDASGAAYDGSMSVIVPDEGPQLYSLELDGDPADLADRDSVAFKVRPRGEPLEADRSL